MRVVAVADQLSSGWYRVRQPARALRGEVDVEMADRGLPMRSDGVCTVDCDVLVLERPTNWWVPDLIRQLQARGVRVVVDIDDDFSAAHALNRAFGENHPRRHPEANFQHFRRAVQAANLVTVSTPALARRYGSHGRVALLRNCVTDDWLAIPNMGDGRTVGWAGAISNHPTDLEVTHGGVGQAVRETGARFLCVGGAAHADTVRRQLDLDELEATRWRSLELHPYLVARLDVGISPLADTRFNAAKSALKGMEYAALGIPFVASPLPEYRRLADKYGLGAIAEDRSRAWRREVKRLLTDRDARAELAREGRRTVAERLVVSANAWRWAEAWASARPRRRHRAAAAA